MNEVVGKIISYLVVPMTLIVSFEVCMRYIFNAPTVWAWDVNMYLMGLMVALCGGYGHLHKTHVGVELLVDKWNPRNRALLNLILSPLILLPLAVLIWFGFGAAWHSVRIGEHCSSSLWGPPIYPLRAAIPIGGALFLLQGICGFIDDFIRYLEPEKRGEC